jgi:phosphatidylglycerol:prolipoprotein diacylglycerol transferase
VPAPAFIPWFELSPWSIGPVQISPFGLLVAGGVLLGSRIAEWHGERTGVPRRLVAVFLLYTLPSGLLASMLLNGLLYDPQHFLAMFETGDLAYPGMSSFGGFLGGVAGALVFRQRERASVFVLGDLIAARESSRTTRRPAGR